MSPRRLVRLLRRLRLRRSAHTDRPAVLSSARSPAAIRPGPVCFEAADLSTLHTLAERILRDARNSVGDRSAAEGWAVRWLALILWLRASRGDARALRLLRCVGEAESLPVSPYSAVSLLEDLLTREVLRSHR